MVDFQKRGDPLAMSIAGSDRRALFMEEAQGVLRGAPPVLLRPARDRIRRPVRTAASRRHRERARRTRWLGTSTPVARDSTRRTCNSAGCRSASCRARVARSQCRSWYDQPSPAAVASLSLRAPSLGAESADRTCVEVARTLRCYSQMLFTVAATRPARALCEAARKDERRLGGKNAARCAAQRSARLDR